MHEEKEEAQAVTANPGPKEVKNDDPNWIMLTPILTFATAVLFFGNFPGLPLGIARQISHLFFP